MNGLLDRVLEAHAGRARRRGLRQVQATIVTRGTLGNQRLPLIGMLAATLLISACGEHQFMAALVEPDHQTLSPLGAGQADDARADSMAEGSLFAAHL